MALNLGIKNLFPTSTDSDLGVQQKPRATFTKEFFIQAAGNISVTSYFPSKYVDPVGDSGRMVFLLPRDFTAIKRVVVVVIAEDGHNDWDLDCKTVFVAEGETAPEDSQFTINVTPDLQSNILEEVDITSAGFDTAKQGDYIGIALINRREDDAIYVVGARVEYE